MTTCDHCECQISREDGFVELDDLDFCDQECKQAYLNDEPLSETEIESHNNQ